MTLMSLYYFYRQLPSAFHSKIYTVLRAELFQNINPAVQKAALDAFSALVRELAGASHVSALNVQEQLSAFLEPILSSLRPLLFFFDVPLTLPVSQRKPSTIFATLTWAC